MASNNKLMMSWHDRSWIPNLNQDNIMDYFSQRSNPFYDRTCNNEVIRMQRGDPSHLVNMTGIEYSLFLVQEPVLYVIKKVHRQSPEKVIPLANYYVLGGVVYQCPDLHSVINSRLLSSLHLIHQAFEEAQSYARYGPSQGYYWKFPGDSEETTSQTTSKTKNEPSEMQRKRVDGLLLELIKQFPPKVVQPKEDGKPLPSAPGVTVRGESVDSKVVPQAPNAKQPAAPPTSINSEIKLPDTKRKKLN
ncbi:PREDICTED: mediator of RNA polymerase II transcription subunit 6-like [Amphimedon queenslandica]|uniref:Mediator of RNA polymerase II transcription subunit 6 n=1 Tax=Amphimedon queenslandica TaxID=400682 RepID=A0AAN0IE01_AMPQE|nr:PREDICTED: mediator of RNA polymerase II transcription subunit 6-like [Amphimedon queenslandica]|eukprot:XP_003386493.1 PREDICTED: mediator of RNA polymerase II transcription subunit 6-like [Amphimedon queenslandica]